GFISIDCGSTVGYLQNETGIWYNADKGFVETGENHMTSSTVNLNYLYFGKQLRTLRCFPEGDRNCYTLKPREGKNNSAAPHSDAPPILNAFEIYKFIFQVDSPTDARDVGAIMDIKSSYQIYKLSWQGDPCLPKQYAWEGLVCKGDSDTILRITSL
ncbi:leucine-rich repeat receptor-like protein kinase at2g19210-like protein, partial [Trifolium pratense]